MAISCAPCQCSHHNHNEGGSLDEFIVTAVFESVCVGMRVCLCMCVCVPCTIVMKADVIRCTVKS